MSGSEGVVQTSYLFVLSALLSSDYKSRGDLGFSEVLCLRCIVATALGQKRVNQADIYDFSLHHIYHKAADFCGSKFP